MARNLNKLQPVHFSLISHLAQSDSRLYDALSQLSLVVSEILKEFTIDASGFFKADVKGVGIRYLSQTPQPVLSNHEVMFWRDQGQKDGLLFRHTDGTGDFYYHLMRGDGGVYTPTLANVANLDGSTAYVCQYSRHGNMVTVSGKVDVNPTAAVATRLGISLPIASAFTVAEDCGGVAFALAIAGQGAAILADAVNDRAQMEWIAGDLTNQPMHFSFMYRVK